MTHFTCSGSLAVSYSPGQILTLLINSYSLHEPSSKRNYSISERCRGASVSGTGTSSSSSYQTGPYHSLPELPSSEEKCIGSSVLISILHSRDAGVRPCPSPALGLKASRRSGLTHSFLTEKVAMWFVCWMGDHTAAMYTGKQTTRVTPIRSHERILVLADPNHSGSPTKNPLGSGPHEGALPDSEI